jgi:hypothetical protein
LAISTDKNFAAVGNCNIFRKGNKFMFKSIIKRKVIKVGDDIDTDQIYLGRYFCLTFLTIENIISDFSKK